jgi:probable F420-dependent oxidoreductase
LKLGVVFPQTEIGADPGGVRAYAEGVQDIGFEHLHAYDHVLGADRASHPGFSGPYDTDSMFHEILVVFGYIAAAAPRLELVTGVVIAPQRQTALLAKQAAEIDVLTSGNFRLGVGLGWNAVEYEALGMNFHDRGRRLEEQIELMRRFWTEAVVTFEGRWHRVTAAGLNPLPVQRPIPIWFGGYADAALRRAALLGDGYLPRLAPSPPPEVGQVLERVREAGRDPESFGIDARISVAEGTPDEWRRAADAWREAGPTHLTLVTTGGGLEGPDAHVRRLEEALEVLR